MYSVVRDYGSMVALQELSGRLISGVLATDSAAISSEYVISDSRTRLLPRVKLAIELVSAAIRAHSPHSISRSLLFA